ncbi:hypothetical protein CVT25_005219 [Psilocybe cyanescens]|uniref:Uncharacterized protein n=1 Tax=Psilocybe cyanescens TaxID=93625 RepID=A0A409WWZ6_PSICY|nr:hypothetical protein CVT25_005219 [Psilocybe cyanescens]
MDPVVRAEKQVEVALEELVATGALQRSNRMDIESLLNPEGESNISAESSDKEIYQAVIDARAAHENLEINGGDDFEGDSPTIMEPQPTRRDVLKASSIITKYISHIDDPAARKIEALLSSLNGKLRLEGTRKMRDTVVTDFFRPEVS